MHRHLYLPIQACHALPGTAVSCNAQCNIAEICTVWLVKQYGKVCIWKHVSQLAWDAALLT